METTTESSPQFVSPTRVDVTDCPAAELPERTRHHRIRDAELYLERRGGRTYLVAEPQN